MEIRKISKDEKLATITLTTEEVSKITSILQATALEKRCVISPAEFQSADCRYAVTERSC